MLVLCVTAASAGAASRFVDTAGSDEAENTCLSSTDPCRTVQRAIDVAEAGDTVLIASGTYQGEFRLNKPLTLIGQGSSTLLEGEPTIQRPVYIQSSVTLEDLRVRGGLNGSDADDAIFIGGSAIQVSLDDVTAEQAPNASEGRNAVYVSEGNTLTMKDSTITGVGSTCLWVSGSATLTESSVSMTPNLRGGSALRVTRGGNADLVDTTIVDLDGQAERGNALSAEGGTLDAIESSFTGPRSIEVSAASVSLTRVKIAGHEAGLVLHGGANTELRDSLIAPPPGGLIGADVLTETESAPVAASLTIVGSTLFANGSSHYRAARAILANSPLRARIANTILWASDGSGNEADIEATERATWSITYSAFTKVSGNGPPPPGSGTNVASIPSFAGQAGGNYQLTVAAVSLLGHGDPTEVIPGETDLAGQQRVLVTSCSGAPDIGAYELVPAPGCAPSTPASSTSTSPSSVFPQPDGPSRTVFEKSTEPNIFDLKVRKRHSEPTLEFRLNEAAEVTVLISKATKRARDGKTTFRRVASFTREADEGSSEIPLGPHLPSTKETSGTYRLTVVATAQGFASARHTVPPFAFTSRAKDIGTH